MSLLIGRERRESNDDMRAAMNSFLVKAFPGIETHLGTIDRKQWLLRDSNTGAKSVKDAEKAIDEMLRRKTKLKANTKTKKKVVKKSAKKTKKVAKPSAKSKGCKKQRRIVGKKAKLTSR